VSSAAAHQILKQIGAETLAAEGAGTDHIILDIQHVLEGSRTGNQSVKRRDADGLLRGAQRCEFEIATPERWKSLMFKTLEASSVLT
jgi:hypothetical protein